MARVRRSHFWAQVLLVILVQSATGWQCPGWAIQMLEDFDLERRCMIRKFKVGDAEFTVSVRNSSIHVEESCPGTNEATTSLQRSTSSPALARWVKPWDMPKHFQAHAAGLCLPCLFHRRKEDGCRRGDECDRCHICNLKEMQRRKHRLQRAARKARREGA
ncbi:unnamed protein product [Effrenium voratum]|uniref:C3H1-type domain-containing protein n=1 Tax=Effrenium voratum TaxID=2562239 RepID=A0AA36HPA7_9DINO|nr:unnamed protein product [Effrenium voratum]CAJ1418802.1 unnamed protein product [Effrenium voratum]